MMATITFGQIHQIVAEHRRAEEARNAPAAVALAALDDLREALAVVDSAAWVEIMHEVQALIDEQEIPTLVS